MAISTSAGARIFIGHTVNVDAIEAMTDEAALAFWEAIAEEHWTEVEEVESISQFGDTSQVANFVSLGKRRVRKLKTTKDAQTTTLTVGRDPLDAGQIALSAAQKTDFNYAFRVIYNDARDENFSPSTDYFGGMVLSEPITVGAATDVTKRIVRSRHQHRDLRGPVRPDRLLISSPPPSTLRGCPSRARRGPPSRRGRRPPPRHPGTPSRKQHGRRYFRSGRFRFDRRSAYDRDGRRPAHGLAMDLRRTGHPNAAAQSNRVARESLAKARAKEQAQTNGKKWKAPAQSPDELLEDNVSFVLERLLGWSDITMNGEPYPFSHENARKLLMDRRKGALLAQAIEFILDENSFTKRSAKN